MPRPRPGASARCRSVSPLAGVLGRHAGSTLLFLLPMNPCLHSSLCHPRSPCLQGDIAKRMVWLSALPFLILASRKPDPLANQRACGNGIRSVAAPWQSRRLKVNRSSLPLVLDQSSSLPRFAGPDQLSANACGPAHRSMIVTGEEHSASIGENHATDS